MILNKDKIIRVLKSLLTERDLIEIKSKIKAVKYSISSFRNDNLGLLNIDSNGETIYLKKQYFENELEQILDTETLERAQYYIKRLLKGILEIKTNKINDINLNRWKEFDDIITDSLWILERRDNSGAHSAEYWGNFIPQIPNQLLRRYTKKGEWVLDPFMGSGTTLIEARRLGINSIGIEIQDKVVKIAREKLEQDKTIFSQNSRTEIITGDSTSLNIKSEVEKIGVPSVQFVIFHPPYWDIIKFSDYEKDLSNAKSLDGFLSLFNEVVDNSLSILDNKRFFAVVIGDKYSKGEWIPLGFYVMQEILKKGHKLKSIIVKNFEETKGKRNQKELWRYRALVGGFYVFKHEYIFLFKRGK
ncbi:DNA methyltransferase [bacterium]|nr:DNA methyltransferase [bacterium]